VTAPAAPACLSCGEQVPAGSCPDSPRSCRHHCNHSWTPDRCCWCGRAFGERPLAVIACGDRHYTDQGTVSRVLLHLDPAVVIEGEARGADTLARRCAEAELWLSVEDGTLLPFPAEWRRYRHGAGPKRNTQMLRKLQQLMDDGYRGLVVAFHDNYRESRGTRDMLKQARDAGVPTQLHERGVVIDVP
jgi:hypothetical protein